MKSIIRRVSGLSAAVVLGSTAPLIAPAPAHAAIPMVFELTGTFTEGVMVSYFGANDEPEVVMNVGLPWSTSFDYNGNARSLVFTGSHPGIDPGSVTCRVSVNGRTIASHTNNAPPAVKGATCNIVNLGKGYVGN